MSDIWPFTFIISFRIRWVNTVSVLLRTNEDSSLRQAYIRGVHGSTVFGNRNDKSPAAIMVLARTVASELLSNTVNRSCKLFSQKVSDTSINLARLRVADARNCSNNAICSYDCFWASFQQCKEYL